MDAVIFLPVDEMKVIISEELKEVENVTHLTSNYSFWNT